jgi:exopolyphosphatase/guanosine-5'-triphosphate,3'-diphosphate pyrophosphatase
MAKPTEIYSPRVETPSHPGIEEVRQWMESVDPEPEHAQQVTRIALWLFDALQPVHGMGPRERDILQAGALVHDVGMSVSNKKHHKRSFQMVKKHRFVHWRPEEVDLFALVARYHRKSEPSMKHFEYIALPEEDREVVRKLSALLRLADGLDRAHLSTVQDIDVQYDSNNIWIALHAYRDCGTEIWGAERKAEMFERVFSRRLILQEENGNGSRPK